MTTSNDKQPFVTGEGLLAKWLQNAFVKAFGDAVADVKLDVHYSTNPAFGDFQCNDAMGLARRLHMAPRAIATKIVENLNKDKAPVDVSIAGPGFINLTVRPEWILGQLAHFDELPDVGRGRALVIDYSSPNVAKSMHIGHIRSTVIGAALDNIFRALGYKVIADNHIGDWGTQFGIIIHGYRAFVDKEALAADPVPELERIYKTSYAKTKVDPEWLDACRMETVKLQQGDPENRALWQEFIRLSRDTFDTIYKRLGIHFDTTRGESYYQDRLPGVVDFLQKSGYAHESNGAIVVDIRDLDPEAAEQSRKAVAAALAKGDRESAEREGGRWICIVRKEDGGFNYNTTDIATVKVRMEDYDPAKMVYVTDDRQIPHFQQFFCICKKLGVAPEGVDLVHVPFGTITDADGHPFSTRNGGLLKLKDLLDEAASRSLAIVHEKNPTLPEDEARNLAEQIGIGAVKYSDLAMDPITTIRFSWDSVLSLQGNSGPYLQYAHARICSVLDKFRAAFPDADIENAPIVITDPVEKQLALQILRLPGTLFRAAENYKPNILADYLYSLSQIYSSFYQRFPILKAEPGVRESRARLCELVAKRLRKGLALLGIAAPERI